MPGVGLLCVIVVFPDQAHLLSFFLVFFFFFFLFFVGERGSQFICHFLGRELPVGQALIVLYMYANSNAAHQPVQYFSLNFPDFE